MGERLAAPLGRQGDVAGAQASGFQDACVGINDSWRAFAQKIDGQARSDGFGVARRAHDRSVKRQVGQTHQHRAGDDAAKTLEIRIGRQGESGRSETDFQDFDAEHAGKRVMGLDQGEKLRQSDPGVLRTGSGD